MIMIKKGFFLISLLAIVLTACNLPQAAVSSAAPGQIAGFLVTADPNATTTPTPFQPFANTPLPTLPATATLTKTTTDVPDTATPDASSTPSAPTAVAGTVTLPEGTIKIVVFGSDWRPTSGFRTDVIMLVLLNPQRGTVSVISFPRDLWVYLPNYGVMQRINVAQAYGGFAETQATFEYNFGIRPDFYIMTNFQGFVQIINSLGGVNVNASINLTDRCDLPQNRDGWCSVGPGVETMDGDTALWYVRSRKSTSDFDRTRRAQEVMQAVFVKLMSLNAITRIPELYQNYRNNVETNINLNTIVSLAPMAPGLVSDTTKIHRYAIGPQHVSSWVTEGGAQVLLPNTAAIMEVIRQAINAE